MAIIIVDSLTGPKILKFYYFNGFYEYDIILDFLLSYIS
jgi:hypothetical protein